MNDKDWLDKVTMAYKVYISEVGPNLAVENYIKWLYKQYGIIPPNKNKINEKE